MGLTASPNVILGSDGAGVVEKVGSQVKGFKAGDKVVIHMVPNEYEDKSLGFMSDDRGPDMVHILAGVGQGVSGTLATRNVFHESCLAKLGDVLTFEEAATLTCSGLTAWNCLMGLEGTKLKKGDWVLVQGSGGVSVAALQIAVASGATVVATTSSKEKADQLRKLGASHIINYRETPEWGTAAKQLTPGQKGFDTVVDIGGLSTLGQSMEALASGGLLAVTGMIGKTEAEAPSLASLVGKNCVCRGVMLGTRQMLRDLVAFVEDKGVRPALDAEVFPLKGLKDALKKMEEQRHFSKIAIQIPGTSQAI